MKHRLPQSPTRLAPGYDRRPFYAIAHRAGNNLHDLERALAAGVDAIECDLWHHHGRLALRHERKLPALPVLYDRWYIRWAWGVLRLRDLLRETRGRCELFIDIKSSTPRAADAVLELYRDNAARMPAAMVSSRQWKLLDRVARAKTDMRMFYSIGRERDVDLLLTTAGDGTHGAGVSIRHTLLSRETIEKLHGAGLLVYAWTVNSRRRGEELLGWGVDGLIADNLDVLVLP